MDTATVYLATLAVGDRVAWMEYGNYNGDVPVMATVEKITPTQFVVKADGRRLVYRFKRETGMMIGTRGWTFLQDPLDGRIVNARSAQRARAALRAVEKLGLPKMPDASTALGVLVQAWKEVDAATKEIETLLADMDAAQAKRKATS